MEIAILNETSCFYIIFFQGLLVTNLWRKSTLALYSCIA